MKICVQKFFFRQTPSEQTVDGMETNKPHWYNVNGLKVEKFQSFGDVAIDYLK